MSQHIYWQITQNCNYQCRHCYQSSSPGKKSISLNNAIKIISHLPETTKTITLTGGEPFTKRPLLYKLLEHINSKFKLDDLIVQTNGFWAKNDKVTRKRLEELVSRGVNSIDISGYDPYHVEQGANYNLLERLYHLREESHLKGEFEGATKGEVLSLGRAIKETEPNEKKRSNNFHCLFGKKEAKGSKLTTIDIYGNTYFCCWMVPILEGNVIDSHLNEIARTTRKDPIITALNKYGPKGLAEYLNYSKKQIQKDIKELGECGFCIKIWDTTLKEVFKERYTKH